MSTRYREMTGVDVLDREVKLLAFIVPLTGSLKYFPFLFVLSSTF